MKKNLRLLLLLALLLAVLAPASALAQGYWFELPQMTVHVFWNEDGSTSLDYVMTFRNDPSGHPIEYVDLAMPYGNFDEDSISADFNGNPLRVDRDAYEGSGQGVAIEMGPYTIPPGETGTVHAFVGRVEGLLYKDPGEDEYASAVFAPAFFASNVVYGTTDLTIVYHLPPGMAPEEPRWHEAPAGFNEEPEAAYDENDRVTYTWHNPNASPSGSHVVGASFPISFVPASVVQNEPSSINLNFINLDCLFPLACLGFFALMIGMGIFSESKRKLAYLPPKIAIEGHGIKRGLTAVEAAVLMEQPLDKVLTMILFSVIKKNAAEVIKQDPLALNVFEPQPEGLHPYEAEFLSAFKAANKAQQRKLMQEMMVNLIKSLQQKLKGFSRKETVDYYKSIMEKAWQQVEAAQTPEVKSEKFHEVMEWTMLDRRYDDRTRDVFRTGPVYLPGWWGRYNPTYGGGATTAPVSSGGSAGKPSGGGGLSMPVLPGADFAASVVGGVQGFAQQTVGNITDFTSRVTGVTNPPPKPTSSGSRGGGGGRSCACACACAGCACACAGGGR